MKNILILSFIFVLSCSALPVYVTPSTESTEGSGEWILDNIEYMTDIDLYGHEAYNASPEETLLNKAGDCRDKAALFLAMEKNNRGKEGYVEIIMTPEGLHAVAVVNEYRFGDRSGRFIEKQSYNTFMGNVGYTWR